MHMVQIQRPYLPEKGGIRFRDKDLSVLQVSASKWHVVDGKKKQVRTTATVRLDKFSDQKTFQIAFDNGVIKPPSPENPGVFELKYPNQNIKGVVR